MITNQKFPFIYRTDLLIFIVISIFSCTTIIQKNPFENVTGVIKEEYDQADNCEIVYQVWSINLKHKVHGHGDSATSGQSSASKESLAIKEGWVDGNTFRTTAIGAANINLKNQVARKQSARQAAILMAQKSILEKFQGAKIQGASGAADSDLSGISIAKEYGGIIKGKQSANYQMPLAKSSMKSKMEGAGSFKKDQAPKKPEQKKASQSQVFYLSADDSNSAASPVIARQMILQGKYVQPEIIRTYEFLNYYDFSYKAPEKESLAIIPQMRKLEKKGEYSLQIAVRSQDKSSKKLKPFNITFLLDISGSMAGEPIDLAKKFIQSFARKLGPRDMISLVTCNKDAETLLESQKVQVNTLLLVEKILKNIKVNEITDLEKGIIGAYKIAKKNYDSQYLNRVIVVSDGAANAGKISLETISQYSQDSDKQGIYLAGIGLGHGFNDSLMNTFTDKGRGAYLFIDSEKEISHVLRDDLFVANFDLALKDVRLKMNMPQGFRKEEFHGEQISTKATDITPQYLSPNDQMIYHLTVSADKVKGDVLKSEFEFEVEYRPIGQSPKKMALKLSVENMLKNPKEILKGDAIVAYAEMLKKIKYPLAVYKKDNLGHFTKAYDEIKAIRQILNDTELNDILALMNEYQQTIQFGERFPGVRDAQEDTVDAILGIPKRDVLKVTLKGEKNDLAIQALSRLNQSTRLVPLEGYKFLALSSGPVSNPNPSGGGQLSAKTFADPSPLYMGYTAMQKKTARNIHDLTQITLNLRAPKNAKSFSVDFNFFSAEYPGFVKKNFNDSFYAIIEAKSTNQGKTTNISFDAKNNPIEVDNNYFENEFHPIPNTGTGFDTHGSTGWLRTSWPIKGGEVFNLTFSIHDEGDGVYDSLVLLDNFKWHIFSATGTTDPLN